MVCTPGPTPQKGLTPDVFNFTPGSDGVSRTVDNLASIATAPWRAFWAVAFEAMDPANYLPRR